MASKRLIADDGTVRTWEYLDDAGQPAGRTTEQYVFAADVAATAALTAKANAALAANAAFLALASPTNAQVVAQVQALTREANAVIRLLLGAVDTTNGT